MLSLNIMQVRISRERLLPWGFGSSGRKLKVENLEIFIENKNTVDLEKTTGKSPCEEALPSTNFITLLVKIKPGYSMFFNVDTEFPKKRRRFLWIASQR